jgi:hypothetical protein
LIQLKYFSFPSFGQPEISECKSQRRDRLKTIDLQEHGMCAYDGKDLFGYGKIRLAAHYYKSLVEPHVHGKSILDIGCGDGMIGTITADNVTYQGLDIGAGIYSERPSPDVSYIRDYPELLSAIGAKSVDVSLLINVLEHTFDFTGLFEKALENTRDLVFVALPNEESLRARLRFLMGKGILTHTLDMHGLHVNHRHLWLIQIPEAESILVEVASKYGFKLIKKSHYLGYPNTKWKRILYKLGVSLLPWTLKASGFSFIFRKATP